MFCNIESPNPAIIWQDKPVSYRHLYSSVKQFAVRLQISEHRPAVLLVAPNCPEWIYALYSIWEAGGIPVPVDQQSTPDEIAYILRDSGAAAVWCSAQTVEQVRAAAKQVKGKVELLEFEAVGDITEEQSVEPLRSYSPDETAVIIYTSGTTGAPKGVQLSFRNVQFNVDAVSKGVKLYNQDTVMLGVLPFHHILPLAGTILIVLSLGGTVLVVDDLSGDGIRAALQRHPATMMVGVPRLYSLFHRGLMAKVKAKLIGRVLLRISKGLHCTAVSRKLFKPVQKAFGGKLKYMVSGGAALDPSINRDMRALGFEILEGYGMTECAPMITFPRPGKVKIGACGQPLDNSEVRIVEGEIQVRGPHVMQGYLNKPEATAEVLDSDGWLSTGDLGELDKKRYLTITGRRKELLILGNGKNISPYEIEQKIEKISPLVDEAAVVVHREQLHLLVRPDFEYAAENNIVNLNEALRSSVVDEYNLHVPSYKRLGAFTVVREQFPRTRLSKLRRHLLPELIEAPATVADDDGESESPVYIRLKEYLSKATDEPVRRLSHLEIDLGLDSLEKVNLLAYINAAFSVKLDEDALSRYATVGELVALLEEQGGTVTDEEAEIDWEEIFKEDVNLELPHSGFLHTFIFKFLGLVTRFLFRIKRSGRENIPAGKPLIFVANHQSVLDSLLVVDSLPRRVFKKTFFFAKIKHFKQRWRRFLAVKSNVIVMDVDSALRESLQKLSAALRQGANLVIFPEGTRSADGRTGQFKRTFAVLAKELDVSVVPVAIDGAYRALPRGKRFPRLFRRIKVTYLPPVAGSALPEDELISQVSAGISAELTQKE